MKDDAFDDVRCPFDYKAELKKARDALNEKLLECVSRDWNLGFRKLAKKFNISASTLFAIARGKKQKMKAGPRPRRRVSKGGYW